jgi:hypothetical protein
VTAMGEERCGQATLESCSRRRKKGGGDGVAPVLNPARRGRGEGAGRWRWTPCG